MLGLIVRRLLVSIPLLIMVSFLVFSLLLLIPGDPSVALAGENATPESIQLVRQRLGLDDPFLVQYGHWLGGVLQGDLGVSLFSSQTVGSAIVERLPVTLSLMFVTLVLAVIFGLAAGVIAALKSGSWIDRVVTLFASLGVALPYFWVGMILVLVFAIEFSIFPAVGYSKLMEDPAAWLEHLILPSAALALTPMAVIARQVRASLSTVLQEDYVRTARAKGMSTARIVGKHALKNAAIPPVSAFGNEANRLIGGAVIIEQLFSLPGLGQLAVLSVFNRDFPMIQGTVLVTAVMVLVINFLIDVSYGYFNPKLRAS